MPWTNILTNTGGSTSESTIGHGMIPKMGTTTGASKPRSRLPRGALTREGIVDASLALLDDKGLSAFSMPKLGRALGADQTAVYRHFASKDDLVLAVADRLLTEAFEGFKPAEHWRATLTDVCHRVLATYLAHPAAAVLSGPRITSGRSEMVAADAVIAALQDAGLQTQDLATYYRVIADFALLWSGGLASFRSLDTSIQLTEASSWTHTYPAADPTDFPHIHAISANLAQVRSEDVFDAALTLMLDAIEVRGKASASS